MFVCLLLNFVKYCICNSSYVSFVVCNVFPNNGFSHLTVPSKRSPNPEANSAFYYSQILASYLTKSFYHCLKPRLLTNGLSLLMDDAELVCGTTSNMMSPSTSTQSYQYIEKRQSVFKKLFFTNKEPKLFIPVACTTKFSSRIFNLDHRGGAGFYKKVHHIFFTNSRFFSIRNQFIRNRVLAPLKIKKLLDLHKILSIWNKELSL